MRLKHLLLSAILGGALLAGCTVATTRPASQRQLVPAADLAALSGANPGAAFRDLMRRNPEALGLALLNAQNKGFVFYRDGSAEFIALRSRSDKTIRTRTVASGPRQICLAADDAWNGACITPLVAPDGGVRVFGALADGTPIDYMAKGYLLRPPAES